MNGNEFDIRPDSPHDGERHSINRTSIQSSAICSSTELPDKDSSQGIVLRSFEGKRFQELVGRPEIVEYIFSMTLFHKLTESLAPKLCRSAIAFKLCDEIMQQAYRAMYSSLARHHATDYKSSESVESYLTRFICRHLGWARNSAIRRERRRRDYESTAELIDQLPEGTFVSERQYNAAFHTAIATVLVMRTELRAAAWLRFFESWTATRIAEVLKVSESTVSRLLDEARETVRLSLNDLSGDG